MIARIYLYCWWILIWFILFLFKIINASPFFSSLIATFFSYYIHFIGENRNKFNLELKIFIISIELLILFILFCKTNINNIISDTFYNILIFSIYLAILFINNKSFYQIYFIDLVNQETEIHNFTMKKYIQERILKFF